MRDSSTWHRITNVDPETQEGDCSQCGRTAVHWKSSKTRSRWACRVQKRKYKRKGREKLYLTNTSTDGYVKVPPGFRQKRLEEQNNLCSICDEELLAPKLDHCHSTGVLRGMLCNRCNHLLGVAHDNAEKLRKAADYLNYWQNKAPD